ncbi:MAG: cytochrome ubiquinol oxidase subunit I, partial [candidate division Zixibacteria bacterium]
MAAIAIPHVFISHFAIGGGLYLVLTERWARKIGDAVYLEYLKRLTKFFVYASVVLGAVSGVGIWFVVGLLSPSATDVLIHNFVWAWAIEWTFFAIEIAAALIYYHGWKTMSARDHMIVGWIYFVAAWLSLFVINGIVSFMLTPGEWLTTGAMLDGFFNQTFWPTTLFRTGVCVMLAGLYAGLVSARLSAGQPRDRLTRYNAGWGIAGLILMVPSFYWFFKSIPADIIARTIDGLTMPMAALNGAYVNVLLLLAVLLIFGLLIPKKHNLVIAIVAMGFGFACFGEFEWFRESIRKPYIIPEYMYGNSLKVDQTANFRETGMRAAMVYRTGDDGRDLFNRACRSCLTFNGYRPLAKALNGTDESFISAVIQGID